MTKLLRWMVLCLLIVAPGLVSASRFNKQFGKHVDPTSDTDAKSETIAEGSGTADETTPDTNADATNSADTNPNPDTNTGESNSADENANPDANASGKSPNGAASDPTEQADDSTNETPIETMPIGWQQWLMTGDCLTDWRFLLALGTSIVVILIGSDLVITSLKRTTCIKSIPNRAIFCAVASLAGAAICHIQVDFAQSPAYIRGTNGGWLLRFEFVVDHLLLVGSFILVVNVMTILLGCISQADVREHLFAAESVGCCYAMLQSLLGSVFVRLVQFGSWVAFLLQLRLVTLAAEFGFATQLCVSAHDNALPANLRAATAKLNDSELCKGFMPENELHKVVICCVVALVAQASLVAWISAWKAVIDLNLDHTNHYSAHSANSAKDSNA